MTPIPEEWTPDQAESYLREDNDRMLQLLTIHEAVPGHYLQGVYGNRSTSLPRQIFWSGVFAEGWAVYATQVMMDLGFAENDPALLLCHWKYYLRCVANVLIDIGIHAEAMTEDEAVSLMVDGAFQEEAEVPTKYDSGPPLVDAALHVFRRVDADVGPRARPAASARRGVGRSARRRRGAGAAGRGRLRRDAGVRLPDAPRGRHLARLATDRPAATRLVLD